MGIALIIVGGLVVVSIVSAGFDYMSKKGKSVDKGLGQKVYDLENRIKKLESQIENGDSKILHLEEEITFFKNLLENKE